MAFFNSYKPHDRAFENVLAQNKYRLKCRDTGEYLHLSGQGKTSGRDYAWLGFSYQAKELEVRANARDEPWPFDLIPRDETIYTSETKHRPSLEDA